MREDLQTPSQIGNRALQDFPATHILFVFPPNMIETSYRFQLHRRRLQPWASLYNYSIVENPDIHVANPGKLNSTQHIQFSRYLFYNGYPTTESRLGSKRRYGDIIYTASPAVESTGLSFSIWISKPWMPTTKY